MITDLCSRCGHVEQYHMDDEPCCYVTANGSCACPRYTTGAITVPDPYLAQDVACPTCLATPGSRCRRVNGEERMPHDNRRAAYRTRGMAEPVGPASRAWVDTIAHSDTMTAEVPVDVLRAARTALEVAVQDVPPENAEALTALLAVLPVPPEPPSLRRRIRDLIDDEDLGNDDIVEDILTVVRQVIADDRVPARDQVPPTTWQPSGNVTHNVGTVTWAYDRIDDLLAREGLR